jgi:hypothetical protein
MTHKGTSNRGTIGGREGYIVSGRGGYATRDLPPGCKPGPDVHARARCPRDDSAPEQGTAGAGVAAGVDLFWLCLAVRLPSVGHAEHGRVIGL